MGTQEGAVGDMVGDTLHPGAASVSATRSLSLCHPAGMCLISKDRYCSPGPKSEYSGYMITNIENYKYSTVEVIFPLNKYYLQRKWSDLTEN
jgi:hypothetical protein